MFKKRYFPINHNFKTGLLCKLSFASGIILLVLFVIMKIISFIGSGGDGLLSGIYDFSISPSADAFLAFSIILIFVSIVFYFFNLQFSKLAKIAEDVENCKYDK